MRHRRRPEPEATSPVNATPLIDVVLCMIVFFLLVGRLAQSQRTPMRLPESAAGSADMPRNSFVINLMPGDDPSGPPRALVNDAPTPIDGVGPALAARLRTDPTVTVQVRAPRDMAYGLIEPVLEACAAAGVADVRLATERADGAPTGGAGR